jgi:hypothetical protein
MRDTTEFFQRLEAPVFAPPFPYIPLAAGKNPSAFWAAMYDVLIAPGEPGLRLREELRRALLEKRFRTIVLKERFFGQDQFPYDPLEASYKIHSPGNQGIVVYKPIE